MTRYLRGMAKGVATYGEASSFLWRHRLTGYLVLPGIVSLFLAVLLLGGAWWLASWLGAGAADWMGMKITFLKELIYWSVMILIVVVSAFLFFFMHRQAVLIALAPFLSRLAAKTLSIAERSEEEKGRGAVRDLVRSARVNRRYLTRELILTVIFLLIGMLIPGIGSILATILIFLVESKYAGYGLVDYALELKRFPVRDSYRFVGERRGLCVGLGVGYLALMLVPLVGWALAPGLGTVAGTLAASRELRAARNGTSLSGGRFRSPSPPPLS